MGLVKTIGLVFVAGAAGAMISAKVTPMLTSKSTKLAENAGAVSTGVTAASGAVVYGVLASFL